MELKKITEDRRGISLASGIVMMVLLIFAIMLYTTLDHPLTTLFDTLEGDATNAPGGVFSDVNTAWIAVPVALGILAIVWFIAREGRKEREAEAIPHRYIGPMEVI